MLLTTTGTTMMVLLMINLFLLQSFFSYFCLFCISFDLFTSYYDCYIFVTQCCSSGCLAGLTPALLVVVHNQCRFDFSTHDSSDGYHVFISLCLSFVSIFFNALTICTNASHRNIAYCCWFLSKHSFISANTFGRSCEVVNKQCSINYPLNSKKKKKNETQRQDNIMQNKASKWSISFRDRDRRITLYMQNRS